MPRAKKLANHLDRAGRCALLVDGIKDFAVFMIGPTGEILTWNQGAERIKQWSAPEVLGENFVMLYLPEDRRSGRPERNLRDALAFGKTTDIGWRRRRDGTSFWAEVLITALYDAAGVHQGFVKVIRDLTGVNTAEAHARRVAVTRELDQVKNQFMSVVSHELRTPLAAIRGFADLIEEELVGPLSAEQHGLVRKIIAGAERLGHQIDDILDVTLLATGKLKLQRMPMSFAETADGVFISAQGEAAEKDLWLQNHVTHDLPLVDGDPQRVGQLLFNLVHNAIKFSRQGGRVELMARVDGPVLRCEVRDDGVGIEPAQLEAVFSRFQQADMGLTRPAGGLGVGLYIGRTLVEAHGGHMGVLSDPGHGSTFWFTLPLAAATPAAR